MTEKKKNIPRKENIHEEYENVEMNYRYNDMLDFQNPRNNEGFAHNYGDYNRMEYENEESSEAKKTSKKVGRKKINMEYIEGKNKRSVTFSKRKKGIMKKAYELNVLTGTQILLLVASESGHVYTFATPKLKPIISNHERLIQQCLNAPSTPPEKKQQVQHKYMKDDEQEYEENYYHGLNDYYNNFDGRES